MSSHFWMEDGEACGADTRNHGEVRKALKQNLTDEYYIYAPKEPYQWVKVTPIRFEDLPKEIQSLAVRIGIKANERS